MPVIHRGSITHTARSLMSSQRHQGQSRAGNIHMNNTNISYLVLPCMVARCVRRDLSGTPVILQLRLLNRYSDSSSVHSQSLRTAVPTNIWVMTPNFVCELSHQYNVARHILDCNTCRIDSAGRSYVMSRSKGMQLHFIIHAIEPTGALLEDCIDYWCGEMSHQN